MQDLKEAIEGKRTEIERDQKEISVLKTQLGQLIIECEALYNEYDEKRIQVNFVLYFPKALSLNIIRFLGTRIETQS